MKMSAQRDIKENVWKKMYERKELFPMAVDDICIESKKQKSVQMQ